MNVFDLCVQHSRTRQQQQQQQQYQLDRMSSSINSLGRFGMTVTPRIKELLDAVAQHEHTPEELKQLCRQYMQQDTVPWRLVQQACSAVRHDADQGSDQEPAPVICHGSSLVFSSPPARQRSKQLQERLATLQDKVDEQRYAAMVADVARLEQQAAAAADDPFFPTTKLQLSYGLHVIVTMGAFFALFYYCARFLFPHNTAWAAVAGALGITAGLLLETTLLIIRQNMPMPLERKYAHLVDKNWEQQQASTGVPPAAGKSSRVQQRDDKQQHQQQQQQQRQRQQQQHGATEVRQQPQVLSKKDQ